MRWLCALKNTPTEKELPFE
jgi:hypothetical protein